jgi:hypothetical protein
MRCDSMLNGCCDRGMRGVEEGAQRECGKSCTDFAGRTVYFCTN